MRECACRETELSSKFYIHSLEKFLYLGGDRCCDMPLTYPGIFATFFFPAGETACQISV